MSVCKICSDPLSPRSRLTLCKKCSANRHYWAKAAPSRILKRVNNLKLYSTRMDYLLKENTNIRVLVQKVKVKAKKVGKKVAAAA